MGVSAGSDYMKYLLLLVLGFGALVWVLASAFPDALSGPGSWGRLVQGLILVSFIGSAAVWHYRGRMGQAAKHALAWVAIFLLLILGYSFREDLAPIGDRMAGTLVPARPMVNAQGDVEIRMSQGGHFYVDALVNGREVRFMVDTGASSVALSAAAAERLGYDLEALTYNRPYNTANGVVMAAAVMLDTVKVGPIVVHDVRASVHPSGLDHPLLGMSFLERLSRYEVRGETLRFGGG